jgi:hypothetical protein
VEGDLKILEAGTEDLPNPWIAAAAAADDDGEVEEEEEDNFVFPLSTCR